MKSLRVIGRTQKMLELAEQAAETENVVVVAANHQQARDLFARLGGMSSLRKDRRGEGDLLLRSNAGKWIRVILPRQVRRAFDGTFTFPGSKARVFVDHFVEACGLL